MIWGNSDPCHPSLVCTGGSRMAVFEVKIRSQWQGYWNQSGNSLTPYIKS